MLIVVLGLYRGGSSTVAGVLHHLGVCMGHSLKVVPSGTDGVGYCTFEDWALRLACLRCYSEPHLEPRRDHGGRVGVLRQYLVDRLGGWVPPDHARDSRITRTVPFAPCACQQTPRGPIGLKFPMLCYMGPEADEAWEPHRPVYVSVQRDPHEVAHSLKRWYGGEALRFTERLVTSRAAFLDGREHVRVDYDRLCLDPAGQALRLARLLGLKPDAKQLEKAARFVRRPVRAEV